MNKIGILFLVAGATTGAWAAEVPAAYRALWNDKINAEIDARIEKHRKADATADGLPAGAEVKVEQISHAFQFGSHIFNFDQLGRDDWNAQYRATFTNLWNAATVAFYWDRMETKEGEIRYGAGPRDTAAFWKSVKDLSAQEKWTKFPEYRRPAPDPVLDFLDAHGISAHGHPMIYPNFTPAWATNGIDQAGLAKRYERRIRQLGEHYGARLDQWDVVNETVDRSCTMAGPFHDTVAWGNPKILVPKDYTFLCHKWAAEAFPASVKFEMNDSWRPIYVPFIQSLIDRGAKIDVVGVQMHIFHADDAKRIAAGEPCISNETDWRPRQQLEMLWMLDTLKRPIHISEITIPAPDDTPEGEETQARMIRDNYRLWFSWPSVYRITYWNLVDHTYSAEDLASGLYASDMRKKKAYYALDQLINHEWKTRLTLKADAAGRIAFRGFKGRYRLTWKDADGKVEMKIIEVK
jgi:endo-1,4-beta-xylanase